MEDFLLGEEDILQRVDEYSLYSFYLGYDPDPFTKYKSPVRSDDDNPSFGVFHAKRMVGREFAWKDQAMGVSGDIFRLLMYLYGYPNKSAAVRRIASDFGLGPKLPDTERIVRSIALVKEPTEIRVIHRKWQAYDLKWWAQYYINQMVLDSYQVRPISCYWVYPSQKVPKFPGKGIGYDYPVGKRHKLYFPMENKDFKFRNDMTEQELEGFQQLTFSTSTLVITKSLKDVMLLREFGYDAVAPRGENTLIDEHYLRYLETRYTAIYTLFDNDGKHKGDHYPYPLLQVPVHSGQKDPTDFCKRYGPQATRELLQQLIP